MKRLFLVCALFLAVNDHAVGQDNTDPADPFGSGSASSDDPFSRGFEENAEQEAARNAAKAKLEAEQARLDELVKEKDLATLREVASKAINDAHGLEEKLHLANVELNRRIEALQSENNDWKQENEYYQKEYIELRQSLGINQQIHDGFVKRLILSQEASNQLIGLSFLSELGEVSRGNPDNEWAVSVHLDRETVAVLEELTKSDDRQIQTLAINALIDHSPAAIQLGYQKPGGDWKPVQSGQGAASKARKALGEKTHFYYDEVPLVEVVDDLEVMLEITTNIRTGVDEDTLVTFQGDDQRLATALESMLSPHDLTYRVSDNQITILPIDDVDATATLTYNVRGLLTEELDIERVQQLLKKQFEAAGKTVEVEVADKTTLVVIANEVIQGRISAFLGALAR